jgi:sugar lactone lactonase YvrE
MPIRFLQATALFCAFLFSGMPAFAAAPVLETVATLDVRPAGLAVSRDSRIFVTIHPSENPEYILNEVKDGKLVPYPNAEASRAKVKGGANFSAAVAARTLVEGEGQLVALEMGDAKTSAKLVGFELGQNVKNLDGIIARDVLSEQSVLGDFAYDWDKYYFFVTDRGNADPAKPVQSSVLVYTAGAGMPRKILRGFAGIGAVTIDPQREWLYLAAPEKGKLYRAPVLTLINPESSEDDITKSVTAIADKPETSGGMTVDAAGNVYFGVPGEKAIGVIAPNGTYKAYLTDASLSAGVESFSFGPDGYLYAAIGTKPYRVVRFTPLAPGAIGR